MDLDRWGTFVIWIGGVFIALVIGVPLQLLLWWHGDVSLFGAVRFAWFMWGFYVVGGVLVAQRCVRRWEHRKSNKQP